MNLKVAVVYGGFSSESEVSLKSGSAVIRNIDTSKYTPYGVWIDKSGWYYQDEKGESYPIDKNDFSFTKDGQKTTFDIVFNAIHGTPGEDGILKSYFDLIGMKMTGCSAYAYAITFNKRDCISILKQYGIKVAQSVFLNEGDLINEDSILAKVGLPCFVKPNKAGSSKGMSKVKSAGELQNAIILAYKEDNEIIIESFLDGMEVSIAVMEIDGEIKPFPMTEIVSFNEFFDYEAKYEGKSEEITPARVSEEVKQKVEQAAVQVYKSLGMKGISRSEFILVNGEPYFLEINTTPGLTEASLLPQQAAALGWSFTDLINIILEEALR